MRTNAEEYALKIKRWADESKAKESRGKINWDKLREAAMKAPPTIRKNYPKQEIERPPAVYSNQSIYDKYGV